MKKLRFASADVIVVFGAPSARGADEKSTAEREKLFLRYLSVDMTRGDVNVSGQDFGIVYSFRGWNDSLPGNDRHDGCFAWLNGDCAN